MADELSELDELIESDVLEALGEKVAKDNSSLEIDGIIIEDIETPSEPSAKNEENSDEISIKEIEDSSEDLQQPTNEQENIKTVNSTDLVTLLSELLNNKTIEITIKIKD